MDNIVKFKGSKDGIIVSLSDRASIDEIKEELIITSENRKKFFSGTKTALVFKGRTLSNQEIEELTNVIAEHSELNVIFSCDDIYVNKYLKPKEKNFLEGKNNIVSEVENQISNNILSGIKSSEKEGPTLFHRGSMRSGHSIKYSGSVVIFGDMNPGSEVIAEGNIIILGNTKGLVHAGCNGNRNCIIYALKLDPIQIRISDIITYIPKDIKKNSNSYILPSYAYIKDDKIYINEM